MDDPIHPDFNQVSWHRIRQNKRTLVDSGPDKSQFTKTEANSLPPTHTHTQLTPICTLAHCTWQLDFSNANFLSSAIEFPLSSKRPWEILVYAPGQDTSTYTVYISSDSSFHCVIDSLTRAVKHPKITYDYNLIRHFGSTIISRQRLFSSTISVIAQTWSVCQNTGELSILLH